MDELHIGRTWGKVPTPVLHSSLLCCCCCCACSAVQCRTSWPFNTKKYFFWREQQELHELQQCGGESACRATTPQAVLACLPLFSRALYFLTKCEACNYVAQSRGLNYNRVWFITRAGRYFGFEVGVQKVTLRQIYWNANQALKTLNRGSKCVLLFRKMSQKLCYLQGWVAVTALSWCMCIQRRY